MYTVQTVPLELVVRVLQLCALQRPVHRLQHPAGVLVSVIDNDIFHSPEGCEREREVGVSAECLLGIFELEELEMRCVGDDLCKCLCDAWTVLGSPGMPQPALFNGRCAVLQVLLVQSASGGQDDVCRKLQELSYTGQRRTLVCTGRRLGVAALSACSTSRDNAADCSILLALHFELLVPEQHSLAPWAGIWCHEATHQYMMLHNICTK